MDLCYFSCIFLLLYLFIRLQCQLTNFEANVFESLHVCIRIRINLLLLFLWLQGLSPSTRPLVCYYETKKHPLLILSPSKVEELTDESLGLRFYHHVITNRETQLLKDLAAVKVCKCSIFPIAKDMVQVKFCA